MISEHDEQQAFSDAMNKDRQAWAQAQDQRMKNNATRRAMRYLCSIAEVDFEEVVRAAGEADPMAVLCRDYLPETSFGKIGLYLPVLKPAKAFSMFLIKPKKATERLEKDLEEAMCIYPAVDFPIIGVIFHSSDKKMFVYCNSGVVDKTSVTVLRFMKRTRFIYSLDAFCRALGLWRRDDPAEDN